MLGGNKIDGLKRSRPKFQSEAKNLVNLDRLFLNLIIYQPYVYIFKAHVNVHKTFSQKNTPLELQTEQKDAEKSRTHTHIHSLLTVVVQARNTAN